MCTRRDGEAVRWSISSCTALSAKQLSTEGPNVTVRQGEHRESNERLS